MPNFEFLAATVAEICRESRNSKIGSRDQILEFWDPLHISETVAARNSKFGMQMDPEGN